MTTTDFDAELADDIARAIEEVRPDKLPWLRAAWFTLLGYHVSVRNRRVYALHDHKDMIGDPKGGYILKPVKRWGRKPVYRKWAKV